MARWVKREVFPGPQVQSDAGLSELARATCHTVYHVSCTARMGGPDAVLDPELRVRGVDRLRVIDASAFPALTTVNPGGGGAHAGRAGRRAGARLTRAPTATARRSR
jgi:choline dehydrogenase-like flavoprotein